MQALKWVDEMVAAVPAGWDPMPKLESVKPNERVLGPVPEALMQMFTAALWASTEAEEIVEAHVLVCANFGDAGCLEAKDRSNGLSAKGTALGSCVMLQIREEFATEPQAKVTVRKEGVVVMEREENKPPLEDLLKQVTGLTIIRL